jgi:hypothetical protein
VQRLIHPSLWGRTRSKAEGATVHRTVAGRNLTLLRASRSAAVKFLPFWGAALMRRFGLPPHVGFSCCLVAGGLLCLPHSALPYRGDSRACLIVRPAYGGAAVRRARNRARQQRKNRVAVFSLRILVIVLQCLFANTSGVQVPRLSASYRPFAVNQRLSTIVFHC